jgi:hypothetical protein
MHRPETNSTVNQILKYITLLSTSPLSEIDLNVEIITRNWTHAVSLLAPRK